MTVSRQVHSSKWPFQYFGNMTLFILLTACSTTDFASGDAPESGERIDAFELSFDQWDDIISIQAGVDERCAFLAPVVDDPTTRNPPLQAFWVIYDEASDVEVTEYESTFFRSDLVVPSDFAEKNGKEALGFSKVADLAQTMMPLEAMEVEGSYLYAELGSPLDLALQIDVVSDHRGCRPVPQACWLPCDGDWQPALGMDLELGSFYKVLETSLY
jgi:hypothetical protein